MIQLSQMMKVWSIRWCNNNILEQLDFESMQNEYTPELAAGLISRIFFIWADPIIRLGSKRAIEDSDLKTQPPHMFTLSTDSRLQNIIEHNRKTAQHISYSKLDAPKSVFKVRTDKESLLVILWTFTKFMLLKSGLLKLGGACAALASPLILRQLLQTLQEQHGSSLGFILAFLLFGCALTQSYCHQHLYWNGVKDALQVRSAVMCAIYRKLFKVSTASRQQYSVGQLTNLVSVDCSTIMEFIWNPHDLWASPLILTVNVIILFVIVGYGGFVALLYITLLSKNLHYFIDFQFP